MILQRKLRDVLLPIVGLILLKLDQFQIAIYITLDRLANTEARIALVKLTDRVKVRNVPIREVCEPVEHGQVIGWKSQDMKYEGSYN